MRLPLIASIVTLYVAISTHAVPAPCHNTEAPLASIDESCYDPLFCEQFVPELASNFSSFYLQKAVENNMSIDTVISPLSLFIPLSMLSYGARGETRKMFLDAIGLPESKTRMAKVGYENFLDKLAKYDVRVKTKIFVPSGVTLKPDFVDLSTKVFNSEIEFVNVTDGFINSSQINEGVAAVQTNNNVTSLFEQQKIARDPSIGLVNSLYFKGIWKKAFDSSLTSSRPFRVFSSAPFDVPTMHTIGRFRHGRFDEFQAKFIELPYKSNGEDDAMSLFIIVPETEEFSFFWADVIYEIRNMNLNRFLNGTEEELEVYLPKFKIDTEVSLNSPLIQILNPDLSRTENHVNRRPDVGEIRGRGLSFFESPPPKMEKYPNVKTGNFSGIFESPRLLNIGESRTKVVIEVDEEGERATESSGILYKTSETASSDRKTRSVAGSPKQFKVDRSFYAVILTKGKVLTTLFSMFVPGFSLIPKDAKIW